jgi:hypothetical protein
MPPSIASHISKAVRSLNCLCGANYSKLLSAGKGVVLLAMSTTLAKPDGQEITFVARNPDNLSRLQLLEETSGEVVTEMYGLLTAPGVRVGKPIYFLNDQADVSYMAPEQMAARYNFESAPVTAIREVGPRTYLLETRQGVYRLLDCSDEEGGENA